MKRLSLARTLLTCSILASAIASPANAAVCNSYALKNLKKSPACVQWLGSHAAWTVDHDYAFKALQSLSLDLPGVKEAMLKINAYKTPEAASDPMVKDAPGTVQYYISAAGAGDKTGSSVANAMPWGKVQAFVKTIVVPARLNILPGNYSLNKNTYLSLGETPDAQGNQTKPLLKIIGAGDSTVFTGDYTKFVDVPYAFRQNFATINRSNLVIGNFKIHNTGTIIYVGSGATTKNVLLKNITAENMGQGIQIKKGGDKVVDNWTIDNVDVLNYYEYGFRITGGRTTNITIKNSTLDAGLGNAHDCWVGGIQLLENVKNTVISDSRVMNNRGNCVAGTYQQGDGIEADDGDSGHDPDGLLIKNVTSSGNADGNFDLKATNVVFDHPVSVTPTGLHYQFRLWYSSYKMIAPIYDSRAKDFQLMGSQVIIAGSDRPASALKIGCEGKQTAIRTAGLWGALVTDINGVTTQRVCR